MSTILKALRQSEAARRTGPRLGAPASARPGRTRPPPWAWRVTLVATVVLAGGAVLWYVTDFPRQRAVGEPTQAPRVAQASLPGARPDAGETAQAVGSEADARQEYAGAVTAREAPKPAQEALPVLPDGAAPESRPTADGGTEASQPEPAVQRKLDRHALLPRLDDLSAGRRGRLPELSVNAHVFAEEPADRFVLINLKRFGEGDTVASGLRVAEIYPRGVVLEDSEGRFVLPRP